MNLAKGGTIISVKEIAKRTTEVAIRVPDNFIFDAGQYIWLMLPALKYPDAKGNTRMFSIASSPNKKGELDIAFRAGRSGYKKTLIEMAPGAEVVFSGPYGPLKLPEDNSRPIVFIAGGIGVTPFLSMIRFSTETHSGHKIMLIYANADKGEAAYFDELIQIEKENQNFKLYNVFGPMRENQLNKAVDGYIGQKPIWSVIGSEGFTDFVARYLNKADVPFQDIIFEQFYPILANQK